MISLNLFLAPLPYRIDLIISLKLILSRLKFFSMLISRRLLLHNIAFLAHFLKVLFSLYQPLLLEDAVTHRAGTIDEDLLFMS